jgi:Zn finger protein HypA/HybF involved in hydrogenase expression
MMLSSIASGIKTATEITQDFIALKVDAAVSAKAVELNRILSDILQQLLSSQTEQAAQASRIRDLEAEIMHLKHWKNEKKRYGLQELVSGTFVYRVKPGMEKGEPVHDLCPHCYQQDVKSILQRSGTTNGCVSHICPHCKTVFSGNEVDFSGSRQQPEYDPFRVLR